MQTKKILLCVAVVLFAFVFVAGCAGTKSKSPSEKDAAQDSMRAMKEQSLAQLYQNEPAAKSAVANAAGYAVFSDFGFKVMLMGGAHGKGMAVNNATKQETFMKMLELQPGLGLGAEKYRLVLIFETQDAFNTFVTSGWELGANAMAAAKDDKGAGAGGAGALTFRNGVKMYQLSDTGAIAGVSITGAKYYKDDDLN
jgi:lipid-binding SYLF domain-containing protein